MTGSTFTQSLINDSRKTFHIPKMTMIDRRDTSKYCISNSWGQGKMLRSQCVNTIIFVYDVISISVLWCSETFEVFKDEGDGSVTKREGPSQSLGTAGIKL